VVALDLPVGQLPDVDPRARRCLAGLANAEADVTHGDDGVALRDDAVDGVVRNLHRASERLEEPGHVVLARELAGPRDDRVQVAHEPDIVGELVEDVGDISAPEGLEDPLNVVSVLYLIRGHATAPPHSTCKRGYDP